jgi:hypothetical protein
MYRRILYVACVITLSCIFAASVCGDDDSTRWVLKTSKDAETVALKYTGFDKLGKSALDIRATQLVVAQEDRTPFLKDSINGRNCWQIKIEVQLKLEMKFALDSVNQSTREFVVLLDAETGRLFGISAVMTKNYEDRPPLLPAEKAENMLRQMREIFHGIPSEQPVISFVKALNYVEGSPFEAKEIYASYVMYSQMRGEPHPVWYIDLRGITPIVSEPGKEGLEHWNHMRSVIDARTGKHIRSTNLPG